MSIRGRRPADLDPLCAALAGQQPQTRYPYRWPLPMPTEDFIARSSDEVAWVAVDPTGRPVGHVAVAARQAAHRTPFGELLGHENFAVVTTLFVAAEASGRGHGAELLQTAVAHIRAGGRTPVLDVLPVNDRALAMYRRRGWRHLGSIRPDWLSPQAPAMDLMALDLTELHPSPES